MISSRSILIAMQSFILYVVHTDHLNGSQDDRWRAISLCGVAGFSSVRAGLSFEGAGANITLSGKTRSSRSTDASRRVASCVPLPYCYAHVGAGDVLLCCTCPGLCTLRTMWPTLLLPLHSGCCNSPSRRSNCSSLNCGSGLITWWETGLQQLA